MGGWRRWWRLGALLAGVSCTSAPDRSTLTGDSESAPSPSQPVPVAPAPDPGTGPSVPGSDGTAPGEDADPPAGDASPPPLPTPKPLKCTPPESHDAGIPQLPDGGDPPTLPPSDCVPCDQTPPAHEAQACTVFSFTPQQVEQRQYDAKGVLREFMRTRVDGKPVVYQQYDADGHLLQKRLWHPGDAPSDWEPYRFERYTWSNGLLMQYGWTPLPTEEWNWENWAYDAQRRPVTRTLTEAWAEGPHVTVYQYIYENDRLTRVERRIKGETADLIEYRYDAAGRLVETLSKLGDGTDSRLLESRTYDGAGWLRDLVQNQEGSSTHETYDALGRLLTTSWMGWEDGSKSARVYDDAGHLLSLSEGYYGMGGGHEAVTRYLYDKTGQLSLDWWVRTDWVHMGATTTTHQTNRTTHLCDSSLLSLTETDSDGDGVVDSRCTYSRDAQGRLLIMECAPLNDPSAFTSRLEYHYDCTP